MTREQYIEMLIDDSLRDASEIESGFLSWCEHHVPIWRKQGRDETWIRLRIKTAQTTRGFLRTLKVQGLMSRYLLSLFDAPEILTTEQIPFLMKAYGEHLRTIFLSKHGYLPEDSTTPYVPVTIDGPQDHDSYYAKEYP